MPGWAARPCAERGELVTRPAPLAKLDMNLLVTLRELLRERNVTRAAERLGVTQPAASAALSRLRRHFGDELLVRRQGRYALTPLACQLAEQVEAVCAAAERLFAASSSFEPSTSEREFTLLMADYTIAVIGPKLSQLLHAEAPLARLHVRVVRESLASEVPETIRFIDAMVTPPVSRFQVPDIRSAELFRDRWVCVVSAHNRLLDSDVLELDDLARLPWVAPYYQDERYPPSVPIARQLTLLGIRPRVAARVESYMAVPYFVTGTDRIALMQERLASRFVERLDLKVLECPGAAEPITELLWWHAHYDDDPAHAWLRQLVLKASAEL